MALTACKSCKHQVDTSAKTCPNCGVANPGVTFGQQFAGVAILLVIIAVVVSMCSGDDDEKKTAAPPKIDDATCMKSLSCWGDRHLVSASVYCKDHVEKLGKFSARWTDGTFETKFSHFRWANEAQGIVTFIGDKIEFQNGFGAFQKHIYECDFNPTTNAILDVRARPGQL
ncbi:zinc ribbon domain-containing protein [Pseudomonas sp. PDM14]|uniref:zinc ribbon domain-containing protein n=1 Tax=Pseudomonas sp. PDM14 TaxID=2769288 RepID=UPI00177ED34B|nr:zinc ribbon domain-containing protein [Pseudomonas sp. PDM14]MBD9483884.1 zinc ribbon domain-containing protein [Pseudomonas sp. PDM14]